MMCLGGVYLAGQQVECFIPGNGLPARVAAVLGAGAAQRVQEAPRSMDGLWGGLGLDAQRLPGGMAGVGLDARQSAIFHGYPAAAARNAQGAVAGSLFSTHDGRTGQGRRESKPGG